MSSRVMSRVNDVELKKLLIDLVKIPSVNPRFMTSGEPNEAGIVKFLGGALKKHGFDVEEQTLDGIPIIYKMMAISR